MSIQSNTSTTNPLSRDLDSVLECSRELWGDLRGSNMFITGGTGWIGSWLLESFCWANSRLNLHARATVLTRNPQAFVASSPQLALDPAITLTAGDVRSFQFPKGHFSHIIHGASESSAKLNREDPALMFDTIIGGTRRALEFAAACGTRNFLLISSGAVYGPQPVDLSHVPETFLGGPDTLDSHSAYPEGKRAAELDCVLLGRSAGINMKIARCFAFVGPYMKLDAHFAIGNFIRDHLKGGPIVVQGDGRAVRSYMYMTDLVVWLWTILLKGAAAQAYNVGSEDAISIAELAQEVARVLRPPAQVEIEGRIACGAASHRYVPSTKRAQGELGLRQQVSLQEAIRKTHAWFARRQAYVAA